MVLILPLPNKGLSPNARLHWRRKSRLTVNARKLARLLTLAALNPGGSLPVFRGYAMAFYYPDRRKRDDDNSEAGCKAYRDGIADALGVDDASLRKVQLSRFEVDRLNPRLEITLLEH
jgi:crossover junction endodeoxyribonuclease RusA